MSRAAERAARGRAELEEAILAARRAGHSLMAVAELAGISYESVPVIEQRKEVKKK